MRRAPCVTGHRSEQNRHPRHRELTRTRETRSTRTPASSPRRRSEPPGYGRAPARLQSWSHSKPQACDQHEAGRTTAARGRSSRSPPPASSLRSDPAQQGGAVPVRSRCRELGAALLLSMLGWSVLFIRCSSPARGSSFFASLREAATEDSRCLPRIPAVQDAVAETDRAGGCSRQGVRPCNGAVIPLPPRPRTNTCNGCPAFAGRSERHLAALPAPERSARSREARSASLHPLRPERLCVSARAARTRAGRPGASRARPPSCAARAVASRARRAAGRPARRARSRRRRS